MTETRSGLLDAEGGCHTCDGYAAYQIRWSGKNALACAANHARHHPGHSTWATQTISVSYGPRFLGSVDTPAPDDVPRSGQ